jgi:hypothetical protein
MYMPGLMDLQSYWYTHNAIRGLFSEVLLYQLSALTQILPKVY